MALVNKVVIIGGSTGGASVAARLRRLDEDAEIILLERSETISYAACGLPFYLGGVIKDETRLQILTADEFSHLFNVDVRTRSEVFSIKREDKAVIVRDLETGKVYEQPYHKLVMAPGAVAKKPSFDGANAEHVFTLRNRADGNAIKQYIEDKKCRRVLIVGAGLIGLEVAENLHRLGLAITILEKNSQVLREWDPEMAAIVHRRLRDRKVRVVLNEQISAVKDSNVSLAGGKSIQADIVILAVGTNPNSVLASECGLRTGTNGGIIVNAGMRTADENIFALGDAVEMKHQGVVNNASLPLAGPAYKQARVVADNICGKHVSYVEPATNIIIKVFEMSVARTGATERQLKQHNIGYQKSYTESQSTSSYYPSARSMIVKLLFAANTGAILGAQIVGSVGVDKRIDVIATAMQAKLSVDQLKDLNLSFAPPFSGERDPVNVAGMVASNMRHDGYQVLHWSDFDNINLDTIALIDVRTEQEFELRSVQGAINIPVHELRDRLGEIPEGKLIIVFCNQGKKGYFAHNILRQIGYTDVYNISGGLAVFQPGKLSLTKVIPRTVTPASVDTEVTVSESKEKQPKKKKTGKAAPVLIENSTGKPVATETHDVVHNVAQDAANEMEQLDSAILDSVQEELLVAQSVVSEPPVLDDGIPVLSVNPVAVNYQTNLQMEQVTLEEGPSYLPGVSNEILESDVAIIEVDASGMSCPGPIMKLAKTMNQANPGDIVRITATDMNFGLDVKTWCEKKGHRLLEFRDNASEIRAVLLKC